MLRQKINQLSSSLYDEVISYLENINENEQDWLFDEGIITSPIDIAYWLDSKLKYEGPAMDINLIAQIQQDKKIIHPIIIDSTNEYTVEGRHRLAAAQKFKLDVPVICIFKK